MGVFALSRGEIGRLRFFVGDLQRFFEPRQFLRAAALAGDQREFGLDAGEFRLEAGVSAVLLGDRGFQRVAAGVHRGETLLRAPKLRLRRAQRRLDPLDRLAGLALAFLRLRVGP